MESEVFVRPVVQRDVSAVSQLAASLVSYHRDLDAKRYMKIDRVAEGYARFLSGEIENDRAVVLCAVKRASIVGYAYGTVEGRNWSALLDPHGALHDVFVDPSARRQGVAEKLVLEICSRLHALGAPRVLLHTAVQNCEAQALFAKLGFRSTMLEMTREA
jgi:ribosomal protein S18 acetylase RimI-like enzyme